MWSEFEGSEDEMLSSLVSSTMRESAMEVVLEEHQETQRIMSVTERLVSPVSSGGSCEGIVESSP